MTIYARPQVLPAWAESGDRVQPTNAEIAAGWPQSSVPPSRQRFNFIHNYAWTGVRYLSQRGISEWASTEDYPVSAFVRGPDNKTYRAITANTNKPPHLNPGAWERWAFTLTEFYAEQNKLAALDSPTFINNASGPTRPEGDSTKSYATTEFVMRALAKALQGIVPVGFIGLYSGGVESIPSGWALCDGTKGTPDLTDKFVLGAGRNYAVNAKGGAAQVQLSVANMPPHTHTGYSSAVGDHAHAAWTDAQGWHGHSGTTYNAGSHAHALTDAGSAQAGSDNGGAMVSSPTGYGTSRGQYGTQAAGEHAHNFDTAGAGTHGHNIGMNGAGAHSHDVYTYSTGGGTAHENMPPFYALAYIMRVTALSLKGA